MNLKEKAGTWGLVFLRVLMGLGIANHGVPKVFGGKIDGFAEGVAQMGFPFPVFFAWSAALSELLGGLLIMFGFGTRVAAFFVAVTMAVAAFVRHAPDPLRVKELALAYLVVALALALMGPGKYSLDEHICKRIQK